MALVLADRVKDTTTTTGTGAVTLSGSPPAGFQSFGAAIGNGNTTYYTISGGSEWEVGIGTYNSAGTTLSRDVILSSSNGGSTVNFSAGTKDVFVTYPAEKSVNEDAAGNININITGNAATATVATNLGSGAAGSIPYQTAANTTAFVSTAAGVLVGGTTPSFSTTPTLTGTNFTGIPNAALTNSTVTIGTTSIALGATSLTLAGLTSVTLTQDPTLALQAATKQYVDTLAAEGVSYHAPVKYEAPSPLTATYNNGTAGVGATLTNSGTLGAFTPDGVVASVNDRILIYQQAAPAQNGVYTVTTVGDGSTPWVLTRATDANSYGVKDPNKLGAGDAFFVTSGNTGAGETYVMNTTGTITFGTTAINFVQVSAAQIYSAGTGLTLTGTQFSLTSPVATTLGGTGLTTFTAANRALYSTGATTLTAGTLPVAAGGTGQTTFTDGQILIGRTSDGELVKATISAGTGISVSNGAGSISITNTAPDQVVSLTAGGTTTITGSYPNFNISSADQYVGTVTSVSGTGTVNGLTLTGTVTSSGSLTLGGTLSVNLATNVTGTLPVANGGTGATTFTSGAVLIGNGTSAVSSVSPGTASNVLTSNGSAWVSSAPLLGQTDSGAPYETSLGFEAGLNSSGNNNTLIGYQAGKLLTTAVSSVAIGANALGSATTANGNTAVGNSALALATGSSSTAVGNLALGSLTTGTGNIAVGQQAARYITTGGGNTAIGSLALSGVSNNANQNTAVGYYAGNGVTTGGSNVFVGYEAGSTTTTGTNNIVIGTQASASSATAANEITIGGSSHTRTRLFGFVEGVYSDVVVALGNTGTAKTIDLSQGTVFTATLTGNCTFTLSNSNANSSRGSSFTLILTNDGTAGRTVAWSGGSFKFPGGAASLSRTTTANAVDIWVFFTPDQGTTWYGNISMKNMTA